MSLTRMPCWSAAMSAKAKSIMIYDEIIGESKDTKDADRFAEVEKIEAMSPEERFAFFQK